MKGKSTVVYLCVCLNVTLIYITEFTSMKNGTLSQAGINTYKAYKIEFNINDNHLYDLNNTDGYITKYNFTDMDLVRRFEIAVNGSDVIVLLRIQKTGSTGMAKHLSKNVDVSRWCKCDMEYRDVCPCFKQWKHKVMFLQGIHHWPCGFHADWTLLHDCVEGSINERHRMEIKQRHLYVTMVRDPLWRYVSEWKNVVRGGNWNWAKLKCNGKLATDEEVPRCYKSRTWGVISLTSFMTCESNLAHNRQTRMLANLSLVNCYDTSGLTFEERHYRMLESAKENLKNMAYFGLTEFQELSQILFENTFGLTFVQKFRFKSNIHTATGRFIAKLPERIRTKVVGMNRYDVMLYQFAKDLFLQRLQRLADTTDSVALREHILALI